MSGTASNDLHIASQVITALKPALKGLDHRTVIQALNQHGELFSKQLRAALQEAIAGEEAKKPYFLTFREHLEVGPFPEMPDAFQFGEEVLEVDTNFFNAFGTMAFMLGEKVPAVEKIQTLKAYDIAQVELFDKPEPDLPSQHLFDPLDILRIAVFLARLQPVGEQGILLPDGTRHFFHAVSARPGCEGENVLSVLHRDTIGKGNTKRWILTVLPSGWRVKRIGDIVFCPHKS